MQVGWIGLGKLGLPCALVLAQHHDVYGYDVSDHPRRVLAGLTKPPREEGIEELLAAHQQAEDKMERGRRIHLMTSVAHVVAASEIVFVAAQTPHAPAYGGETPAPSPPRDFEYAYLVQACRDVCRQAAELKKPITLVVVSTVLPGTIAREIQPLLNPMVTLVYSPLFIAMGTTIHDFQDPEFVICGTDGPVGTEDLLKVYSPVHGGEDRLYPCRIESAETIKVFYNVFISTKIVFANTLMEVCHKTAADCDEVVDALSMATNRVISDSYLRGGMGDGGACHPRDLIALSWLAGRLDLSYDFLGMVAQAREAQSGWLAQLARSYHEQTRLPIVLCGKAYKPNSDLTYGSPALLLASQLGADVVHHDTNKLSCAWMPAVYVITTKHTEYRSAAWPAGSVVIDPFGYISDRPGVTVIRLGRK